MKLTLLKTTAFALLIAALAGTACSTPPAPVEDTCQPQRSLIILKKDAGNNSSLRRNAPSMQQINCEYCDGVISLSFSLPEGVCLVEVADNDNNYIHNFTFDSSDLQAEFEVGKVVNFSIKITTEKGNIYTGICDTEAPTLDNE